MTPLRLLLTAIRPALADLASGGIQDTPAARRMLLAIALQESGLRHRRQVTASGEEDGPAASFWQFEKGGGCKGVLTHHASAKHMRWVCTEYNIEPTAQGMWDAMRYNDIVAASAARLLLYTLPQALPVNAAEGWDQYIAAWRPGRPHPEKWAECWAIAERVAGAAP
jgi:hypothetical protein